jgi:hypothetical protein
MSISGPYSRLLHAGIWAAAVCVLGAGCDQKAQGNANRESALAVARTFLDSLRNQDEEASLPLLSEGYRARFRQQNRPRGIRRYTIGPDMDGAGAEAASQQRFVGSWTFQDEKSPERWTYTILLGKDQQSGRWLVDSFTWGSQR